MAVPETRPNHTIYINNLNEKIKKDGEFLGDSKLQAIPNEPAPLLSPASSFTQPSLGSMLTPQPLHMLPSSGFNAPPIHLILGPLTWSLLLILQGFSSQDPSFRKTSLSSPWGICP